MPEGNSNRPIVPAKMACSRKISVIDRPMSCIQKIVTTAIGKSDIWIVDVESGETRELHQNGGSDVSPRWSPDGRAIAFAANEVEASTTMFRKLYLIAPEGGVPRTLLDEFDNQFTTPIWSPDGRRIFWSTGQGTSTRQFTVSIESGAVTVGATPTGRAGGWDLARDGTRWVWVHTTPG